MPQIHLREPDYFSFDDALSSIGSATDFVIPGASQNISNWWNQAEEAPWFLNYPKAVRKGSEFLFNSIVPQSPQDEIFNFAGGAALNIPRKSLRYLGEELLDTIGDSFQSRTHADTAKHYLKQYSKELLGYTGGKGGVVGLTDQKAIDYFNKYPTTAAYYEGMFADPMTRTGFSDSMKELGREYTEDPALIKAILQGRRNKPTIGINEKYDVSEVGPSINEEITHLAQDVAPSGVLPYSKAYRRDNPNMPMPYKALPEEILARMSPRNNPAMKSIAPSDRAVRVLEDFGTLNILAAMSAADRRRYLEQIIKYIAGRR